jgi:Protein of unknown function (DUF3995)
MRQYRSMPSATEAVSSRGAVTETTSQRRDARFAPRVVVEPDRARWGLAAVWAAFTVGLLYAAVSVYWGLGGMWLLDTVGGSLAKLGRRRDAGVITAVWGAAVLKLIAAALPALAVRYRGRSRRDRNLWALTWIVAGVLIVYGLVFTVAGLLVQTGVIHASSTADHRALAWHAYLWDPWFLIWGLLIAAALLLSGRTRSLGESRR